MAQISKSSTKNIAYLTLGNSANQVSIELSSIVYIVADDNYCDIYYKKATLLQRFVVRSSLKSLLHQLQSLKASIVRCHRSYAVNLLYANSITGNSNGYKLTLKNSDLLIPVSRLYIFKIEKLLKDLKV